MAATPPFLAWLIHLLQLPEEMDAVQVRQLQMEVSMSKYEDEIAALNDATNQVAAKVEELRGIINSDDPAVEAALNEISTRLKGLAADPEQPVPPVEEPPAEEPPVEEEPTPAA